jgi:hypothetical protein
LLVVVLAIAVRDELPRKRASSLAVTLFGWIAALARRLTTHHS